MKLWSAQLAAQAGADPSAAGVEQPADLRGTALTLLHGIWQAASALR